MYQLASQIHMDLCHAHRGSHTHTHLQGIETGPDVIVTLFTQSHHGRHGSRHVLLLGNLAPQTDR